MTCASVPRLLVLCGTPPGDFGVGSIFLRDLCVAYPRGKIVCFCPRLELHHKPSPQLEWLPMQLVQWPYNSPRRILRHKPLRFLAAMLFQYNRLVRIRSLADQATAFARQHSVELIWAILNSPTVFRLARSLAKRVKTPLVSTIWDPPEGIGLSLGLDSYSRRTAKRDFEAVVRGSLRCGVISEPMAERYWERYGTTPIVLRHGIPREQFARALGEEKSCGPFVIGFAGTLYASREWQALLEALGQTGWRIAGREVILRVFGSSMIAESVVPARIEYLGWESGSRLISLLSEVDITYLPYWFEPAFRESVELCFPTKLTTYLASGRPVLYHGPRNSSVARFLSEYKVGLGCYSLDPGEIMANLEVLASDRDLSREMTKAREAALEVELNRSVFLSRFAELIGIEPDQLCDS